MAQLQHSDTVDAILKQVDDFYMKTGPVHKTLRELARCLPEEGIEYAVIGGMANLAARLDPTVQQEYLRLWRLAQQSLEDQSEA